VIDDSDGDFALLASIGTPGGCGVLLLALAIVFYVIASNNKSDCAQKHCDVGTPKLMAHECLCVSGAK